MKNFLKPAFYPLALIALVCFALSCGSDDSGPGFSDQISFLELFDVGNAQNANDIHVRFDAENGVANSEVRLFVLTTTEASSADPAALAELPSTAYSSKNYTGISTSLQLNANQTTVSGASITDGVAYQLIAYFVEANLFSQPSEAFTLTNAGPLAGRYTGLWNDNIYSDFAISAVINQSGNNYRGAFYYSGSFTPCCGGDDDGTIIFQVDGTNIPEFQYDQDLPEFMGGCPGLYNGSGRISSAITFSVNFEGEDCEGPHTNGTITFVRVE